MSWYQWRWWRFAYAPAWHAETVFDSNGDWVPMICGMWVRTGRGHYR